MKTSRIISALSVIFFICKCSRGLASINLALNKPSTLSSTFTNSYDVIFSASRANDGDGATMAGTLYGQPSYLIVDLEEQVDVTFILIKLKLTWDDLYVGVGNSPPTSTSVPGQDFGVCKHFTGFPGDWIQTIPCDLSGRYVIIFSDTAIPLQVFEVEVYNTPEPSHHGLGVLDLARGKISVLSSTSSCCPASQGNNGIPGDTAVAEYNAPHPHYWYVDLAGRFQVTSILLYYTGDWTNLTVGVGDNPLTNSSVPGEDFGVCHVFAEYPGHWTQSITCSLSGRYVIIFSNVASHYEIFEVEVYGIPEPVLKKEATFERYQNRRDVMRNVNIMRHLEARAKTECAMWCLNTEGCVAFTYYGTTCRLHNKRAQDYTGQEEQFVTQSGAVYMQVKDEL